MKLIYLLLLSLGAGSTMAQTTIFTEDFQQGIPSSWTTSIQDGFTVTAQVQEYDAAAWIAKVDPANALDTVASSTSDFTTSGRADRWMISPAITLGSFGNIVSWEAKSHDPSFPDNYKVLISNTTNDPASFTDTVALVFGEYHEWQTLEMNLSELGYDNQTVYLAFVLITNGGFKLYVDDVSVRKDDPVGLHEISKTGVSASPNPFTSDISFSGLESGSTLLIRNPEGKIVKELVYNQESLSLEELQTGIYFVEFPSKSGNTVIRIVKF